MVIDFHTHLFPRKMREQREAYFTGEPGFELLYRSPKSRMSGAEDLLEAMDKAGVDRSVIFGFPWGNEEVFSFHNDYIAEKVAQHPERFVGFCSFDIRHPEAEHEAQRCLEMGHSGIGELALYGSGLDDSALDRLDPLMTLARRFDVPVLVHTNEPVGHHYPGKTAISLAQIWNLVTRFPGNKIVLAHWGGGIFFYHLLKREAKEALAHVYVDTAASPFLYDPLVYRLAGEVFPIDRVLFGSDFPLIPPVRYFKEMESAGLSREDLHKVCGANAERLLGL